MQLLQYQPPGKLGGLFVGGDNRVLLMPLSIQNALSEEITADMVIRFSDETLQVFQIWRIFQIDWVRRIMRFANQMKKLFPRADTGTGSTSVPQFLLPLKFRDHFWV